MKKLLILLFVSMLVFVTGCGKETSSQQQNAGSTPEEQPKKELRIASLSIHLTNHLLALGITPVGSVIGGDAKDFLSHVADRLKDTKKLGVVTDVDMEALLALKPDMILVDQQYAGKDLSKYEAIAPTTSFNLDEGTWRDTLQSVAKIVHKEQQADEFIKSYNAEADRVKGLVKNQIGDGTAMAIRVTAKEVRVMGMKRPVGPILFDDLGLKPAKGVEKINSAFAAISQEVLPDYDADAIFLIVNKDGDAEKIFKQLQDNPIWQGLKAVKNNHVYTLDGQPWLDYSSLGQKMALDNAEKLFTK